MKRKQQKNNRSNKKKLKQRNVKKYNFNFSFIINFAGLKNQKGILKETKQKLDSAVQKICCIRKDL